eukprot:UN29964
MRLIVQRHGNDKPFDNSKVKNEGERKAEKLLIQIGRTNVRKVKMIVDLIYNRMDNLDGLKCVEGAIKPGALEGYVVASWKQNKDKETRRAESTQEFSKRILDTYDLTSVKYLCVHSELGELCKYNFYRDIKKLKNSFAWFLMGKHLSRLAGSVPKEKGKKRKTLKHLSIETFSFSFSFKHAAKIFQ